jgi:hypothetical protein
MSRPLVPALIACAFFLFIGVVTVAWPQKIQHLALSSHGWLFCNPLKTWTRSRYYIWSLRITGILSFGAGAIIASSIYRMLTGA